MVHVFSLEDHFYVLDEHSGSVMQIDKLAAQVIERFETESTEKIAAALSGQYASEDIVDVLKEIQELRDQGMLFSPPESPVDLSGEKVIKALCLHVTHDCNLRCRYCFAGEGAFHGDRCLMPIEVGKAALEFLMVRSGRRRNLEVDFFGGEPLMNWDVVKDLVVYGRQLEKEYGKNIRFTITTNGLALDAEKIAYINQEMSNVVISLDGRPEIHDHMRPTPSGQGSYHRIVAKAKELINNREGSYYVRGTFTRHNLDFDKDVVALAQEGFQNISIEPVVSAASADYSLLEEHLPVIQEAYERLAKLVVFPVANAKPFQFFHFMLDLNNGACAKKRLTGCGAGNEYAAITPTGDIYPCHQFVGEEQFKLGNVLEGTWNEERQDMFRQNHVLSKPKCSACWAKHFCSGGCAANAWHRNGDIARPYEMECEMEKKRLECGIAIYCQKKNGTINQV